MQWYNVNGTAANVWFQPAAGYWSGTGTWDNSATAKWSATSGGPYNQTWTAGKIAIFEGTAGTVTVANTGVSSVSEIFFTTDGYTLTGTGAITLTGGNATITTGAGTDTINCPIAGSVGLTKAGPGTLVLSAQQLCWRYDDQWRHTEHQRRRGAWYSPSTPTQNITFALTAPFKRARLPSALATNRNVTINNGATATFDTQGNAMTIPGVISGPGNLTKAGAGTLNLSGTNSYVGGTTINGGTLNINADAALGTAPSTPTQNITFGANGTLQAGAASIALATNRNVTINNGATATFDTQGNAMTIPGVISGPGSLTKAGAGTMTLLGNNTYAGPTAVNGGNLVLTGASQSSSYTANNGGTLQFNGDTINLGFSQIEAASGGTVQYNNATINGGYLRGSGTHATLAGSSNTFNGVTTYNSTVIQQNGSDNFNNFTNGGQFTNSAPLLWNGGVNASSGQLIVNATSTVEDWANNGVTTINGGGVVNNAVSDLVCGGGSRTTINTGGQINANSDGSGVSLDLNGGLLVNNGKINGTTNLYYGSLAKGAGIYGAINVYTGGQFSPGNSPGAVATGSTTWNAGGEYLFEINDASGAVGTPGIYGISTARSRLRLARRLTASLSST